MKEQGTGENTLLISYMFPPAGGVAVQRAISYAKYLGQAGCPVTVLTTRNPVTAWQDPSLLESLPKDLVIERALTFEPPFKAREWIRQFIPKPPASTAHQNGSGSPGKPSLVSTKIHEFLSPDPQKFWVPLAYRKAVQIVKERNIRNVLVTAPPFSSLEIGVRLKARFPYLTLISEFRDEWLSYYLGSDPNASAIRRQRAVALEARAVGASDYVVTVTNSWRGQIRGRYPNQPDQKFVSIPNGFDPQVFEGFCVRPKKSKRLIIAYMGTVYWNKVYSPEPLMDALCELPPSDLDQIELRFVGKVAPEALDRFRRAPVKMTLTGFLPQQEAIRHLEDADCLLLVVNNKSAQAAKLFEYMPTGKPVLALSPAGGEIEQLIHSTQLGWCVDPADGEQLKQTIQTLLDIFIRGQRSLLPQRLESEIEQYARPRLVQSMTQATRIGSYR